MLSGAGGAIVGAAKKFNILDFFKNILLGSLILNLLNIIKEIPKMLETLAANLKAIFFGIRIALGLLRNIKTAPRTFQCSKRFSQKYIRFNWKGY